MDKLRTITVNVHIDELEGNPFTMRENVSNGTLFGDRVSLDREIHGDTHYMNWRGKVYEFKLTNLISAIGTEIQKDKEI